MKKYVFLFLVVLLLLPRASHSQGSWALSAVRQQQTGALLRVDALFSDGVRSFHKEFDYDGTSTITSKFQQDVANTLAALTQVSTTTITVSSATVPAPGPTPAPSAQQTFQQNLQLLQSANRAVQLGIITTAAPEYQSAFSAVQSGYQASFLGLF